MALLSEVIVPLCPRIFVIHLFAVELELAVADIPAAVMAQRVVLPLKAVAVKGIGIAILTVKAVACGKIVVFVRRPRANSTLPSRLVKPSMRGVSPVALLDDCGSSLARFAEAAVGLHSKYAVDQRAAGEELAVIGIPAIAVLLNSGISTQRPGPFLADFFW